MGRASARAVSSGGEAPVPQENRGSGRPGHVLRNSATPEGSDTRLRVSTAATLPPVAECQGEPLSVLSHQGELPHQWSRSSATEAPGVRAMSCGDRPAVTAPVFCAPTALSPHHHRAPQGPALVAAPLPHPTYLWPLCRWPHPRSRDTTHSNTPIADHLTVGFRWSQTRDR